MASGLNKEINLIVQIRLIAKGKDKPLHGNSYKVHLYDKDVIDDDYLGESGVTDGLASFTITKKDFSSPLRLDDKPDFYFAVYHQDKEIFRSKVIADVEISDVQQFVMKEGEVIDLGTYLIETND